MKQKPVTQRRSAAAPASRARHAQEKIKILGAKKGEPLSWRLPERLQPVLLSGHPWIYRHQLGVLPRVPKSGTWIRLECGRILAYGIWQEDSDLALRLFSRMELPAAGWIQRRVTEAWQLRCYMLADSPTDAFRWISGEGDQLPGVVVDYYAGYAVVVLDAPGLETLLTPLKEALAGTTPLKGVVLRERATEGGLRVLYGQAPPEELTVQENGLRLHANLERGQKTGLFLDHRDNRAAIEAHCKGRDVLNLFSYSGAFSLYAARGGARSVVSVDVAPGAARDAQRNFELNALKDCQHETVVGDVFEFLNEAAEGERRFDVAICDPPSFARKNAHLDKCLAAYQRVNTAALRVVRPGGLFATASCTGRMAPDAFRRMVGEAARKARCRLQILQEQGHAPDHPVAAGHPEGRYLKFLLARVLPRC